MSRQVSRTITCDRSGHTDTVTGTASREGWQFSAPIGWLHIDLGDAGPGKDLCPVCVAELKQWLNQ